MAQTVEINGEVYSDVPSIEVPLSTSGTASFYDISDTTAGAEDVAAGKYFYNSSGTRTAGTGSYVTDVEVYGSSVVSSGVAVVPDIVKSFTVTLDDQSWSNSAQTVSNANFIASGYSYIVSPASSSFSVYAESQIYADNVTTNGYMTFHCSTDPSADLTVNIVRMMTA